MSDDEEEIDDSMAKICKVVLVGESGAGKTCLVTRLTQEIFEENPQSTIGATNASKTLLLKDNKTLKLDIWDTAGQETYHSLNKIFYKGAHIAILVYDITQRKSFEKIKSYWLGQIKTLGEQDAIIGICGAKSDLFTKEEVKESEGKEFAKKIGGVFGLTSSLTGEGINEFFKALGEKVVIQEMEKNGISLGDGKKGSQKKCC